MGSPALYNHTQVVVVVEDANDNDPRFEHLQVTASIREDHPLHQPFFAVRAVDADTHEVLTNRQTDTAA